MVAKIQFFDHFHFSFCKFPPTLFILPKIEAHIVAHKSESPVIRRLGHRQLFIFTSEQIKSNTY